MDIDLLYFDDCPNWQETDQRLRQAIDGVGGALRLRARTSRPRMTPSG